MMHGLGDEINAFPMLSVLRQQYPDAKIVVLVKTQSGAELLKSARLDIDNILVVDIYKNVLQSMALLIKLRNMHFDYGINISNTPPYKAACFMRAVNPRQWSGWQRKGLYFDTLGGYYHFVEANLLAVQDICVLPKERIYPRIYADEYRVRQFSRLLNVDAGIVGICVGNGNPSLRNKWLRFGKVYAKGWGIKNIATLIGLLRKAGNAVVMIGGEAELPLRMYLPKNLLNQSGVWDFIGKTTMSEAIALAAVCDCVIGVDTGMQHVAAAVGTPTISIFGPTSPAMCGAYAENAFFVEQVMACRPCYATLMYNDCRDRQCLNQITPMMVMTKLQQILSVRKK